MLNQLTTKRSLADQVTYKDLLINLPSEICQWHSVTFFSQKMISTETHYETHNQELLAIIEAFKTWRHYLKSSKCKVFVIIDHKNLR